jgi:hypothetical protein
LSLYFTGCLRDYAWFSVTFRAVAALMLAGIPFEHCQGHAFAGWAAVGGKDGEWGKEEAEEAEGAGE